MTPRKTRRSYRRAARAQRLRFLAGLAVAVLAIVAAAVIGEKNHRASRRAAAGLTAERVAAMTPASGGDARKVYPYSVIEGGATTADELKQAIESDPVVAAHFAKFDLSKTRVEMLRAPKVTHVSYRKGNDVFWTRKKVVIPAGETVLTDGTNYARTRCGNCLSDVPGPVSADEPPAAVLDNPIAAAALELRPAALTGMQIPPLEIATPAGTMASAASTAPRFGGVGGPMGSGGIVGSSSRAAGASTAAGRQAGAEDAGDPGDPGTGGVGSGGTSLTGGHGSGDPGTLGGPNGNAGNPGNPGNPGNSGNPGNPGNPGNLGDPGNAQGPPAGPQPPSNTQFVPPPFQGDPGDPILPSIDSILPPGDDPKDPLIQEQTLPGGVPGDPGDPNVANEQPVESIPEPGTTVLVLLGGAYAVRRLRRTP